MICNIDTNKAIETGSEYTLKLIDRVGLWGSLLFIIIMVVTGLSVYIIIVYTKKILHRKEYNLEKLREQNKQEELKQNKEAVYNLIRLYDDNNRQLKILGEKIHFSLNIDRITTLTDCFVGIDRSFIQDLKSKLSYHIENIGKKQNKTNFLYLYHEADIIFKQKVIDKLKPVLFKDRTTFYNIEKDCRGAIKQSLDKIREKIENTNIKDVEKVSVFTREELINLGYKLEEIIINSYKKQILGSTDIDYLRM